MKEEFFEAYRDSFFAHRVILHCNDELAGELDYDVWRMLGGPAIRRGTVVRVVPRTMTRIPRRAGR